ncbi:MAG: 50S ribosomal protein L15 [Cyanobacteria bacterium J06641_5]
MRLFSMSPKEGSKKSNKRLGRGISAGQGASCGKGMRGQKSRSGPNVRVGFEGGQIPLYRRVPKLKHFTKIGKEIDYFTVNVSELSSLEPNSIVNITSLRESQRSYSIKQGQVLKVLGSGTISTPLTVYAAAFTKSATEKIQQAGGTCIVEGKDVE